MHSIVLSDVNVLLPVSVSLVRSVAGKIKKRLFLTFEYKSVAIWYWAERKRRSFLFFFFYSLQFQVLHQYNCECHFGYETSPRESFSFVIFNAFLSRVWKILHLLPFKTEFFLCYRVINIADDDIRIYQSYLKMNVWMNFILSFFARDRDFVMNKKALTCQTDKSSFMRNFKTKSSHCLTLILFHQSFFHVSSPKRDEIHESKYIFLFVSFVYFVKNAQATKYWFPLKNVSDNDLQAMEVNGHGTRTAMKALSKLFTMFKHYLEFCVFRKQNRRKKCKEHLQRSNRIHLIYKCE